MADLDELDTAILRELQADARRTNRDIAAGGVAPPPPWTAPAACAGAASSAAHCSTSTSPSRPARPGTDRRPDPPAQAHRHRGLPRLGRYPPRYPPRDPRRLRRHRAGRLPPARRRHRLLAAPPVLFLDEPTTGLDPQPAGLVAGLQRADRTGHQSAADHPVRRGSQTARRDDRHHRPRPGHRQRHPRPARGPGRRRPAGPAVPARPGPAAAGSRAGGTRHGGNQPSTGKQAGSSCLSPAARNPSRSGGPARRRWLAGQRAGPAQAHPGRGIPGLHRPAARPDAARGQRLARRRSPAGSHRAEPAMTTAAGTAVPLGRHAATVASIARGRGVSTSDLRRSASRRHACSAHRERPVSWSGGTWLSRGRRTSSPRRRRSSRRPQPPPVLRARPSRRSVPPVRRS